MRKGAWETSQYDTENYSRADVTGSYMTLLNAAHCVDRIEEKVAEREGHSTIDILSALNGEDSHGTAPLSWDILRFVAVRHGRLLAVPISRYSIPVWDSELL